jgi:hypothetical protein
MASGFAAWMSSVLWTLFARHVDERHPLLAQPVSGSVAGYPDDLVDDGAVISR